MIDLLAVDYAGVRVVVAGAGEVAARRIARLVDAGAEVVCIAPTANAQVAALAESGAIAWERRRIERSDIDRARLVVAATDDADANARVTGWAAEAGIWCVDASDGARGTARIPAIGRGAGLTWAVASDGSPDPSRAARAARQVGAALAAGSADLRRSRPGAGRVILVGAGPGAADLITLRGALALAQADVVVADRLGTAALLAELPEDVDVIDVGKAPGDHPVPQDEINRILVEHAHAGKVVVRLKGGDPFVFGRGGEEAAACADAGVACDVVPGLTSALSVPALAGIPATHRGVADTAVITSGHGGLNPDAARAAAGGATVVVLMGVGELPAILASARDAGAAAATPVAIIERGSTPDERVTHADLATVEAVASANGVTSPAVVVIGEVARPGLLGPSPGTS